MCGVARGALSIVGVPGVASAQSHTPSGLNTVRPFVLVCEPSGECASVAYFEAQAASPSGTFSVKVFGPEQSSTLDVDGSEVAGAIGDCVVAGLAGATLVYVQAEVPGSIGLIDLAAPSLGTTLLRQFSFSCEAGLVGDAIRAAVKAAVSFVGWVSRHLAEPPQAVGAGSEVTVHAG